MRIDGVDMARDTMEVKLPRRKGEDVVLEIVALPLGFNDVMNRELIEPRPPQKGWAKDAKGSTVRDGKGLPIPDYQLDDPAYLEAERLHRRRSNVLMIAEALSKDKKVHFDAKREAFESTEAYCDALYDEMLAVGFSLGDMMILIREITRVSNIGVEAIQDTVKAF